MYVLLTISNASFHIVFDCLFPTRLHFLQSTIPASFTFLTFLPLFLTEYIRYPGLILTFILLLVEDPAKTVQTFIDLIQRHEQSFYSFVHKVHSKGEGLFDNLMRWIERFLTLMREGLSGLSSTPPISLEFLLPHTGSDRENVMKEVDEIAKYHYKLKLAYEAKVRRRFGRTQQGGDDADKEDEAVAGMVNDVVSDLSFGDLVKGDADDLAAEATDEEDSSGESDDGEDSTDEESSGDDEEDSGSEEGESGEEESSDDGKAVTPVARSQTTAHSPLETRPRVSPAYPPPHQKQSLDIPPTPSKSPSPSPIRSARSMTISSPIGAASSSKPLPATPARHSLQKEREKEREANVAPSTTKRKKQKPEGPKPPELEHIPKLLPLFVEMVRTKCFQYSSLTDGICLDASVA